ncbi:SpoIIE family protein phosphatase [Wenjunlia vitaminophila]|uniref:SpoIIE family protein phosphatase n=1 Tax=Wenjunlia vitaminophila TaxID=76728 RepID=UPI00036E541F|nr:SpoIIE family protein phosphatase [Wenjunlia vitaminophila]
MDTNPGGADDRESLLDSPAVLVVDARGVVTGWSAGAVRLLAGTVEEAGGRPFSELVQGTPSERPEGVPASGRVRLRRGAGDTIDVELHVVPIGATGTHLVLIAPADSAEEQAQGVSLMRALFAQRHLALAIFDTDLRLLRINITEETFGLRPPPVGSRISDVMYARDAEAIEGVLRRVLDTGVSITESLHPVRSPRFPGRTWVFSLSAFPLQDGRGRPSGVAVVFDDVTEREKVRRHRDILQHAAARIGFSLDITETAQALADVVAPDLADLASVDLAEPVLEGDEPLPPHGRGVRDLARVATASASGEWPAGMLQAGETYPQPLPEEHVVQNMESGRAVITDRAAAVRELGGAESLVDLFLPDGAHSFLAAPLYARGLLLGTVTAYRTEQSDVFEQDDADLLSEIASRAALGIDSARRFVSAQRAAVALQERLLPSAVTSTSGAETAAVYRPAAGPAGIGGDWYDVIPLPSMRLAFVIGDVIGRGLPATAAMGRLRTAIQAYVDLELPPEEVLTHVEDLVQRLAAEAPEEHRDTMGATCLCAVYDPTTGRCTFASAGQPPPVLVGPDGTTCLVDVSPGPPLGVGGVPFEPVTVDLEPGSVLALYTDGVSRAVDGDIDHGIRHLQEGLAEAVRSGAPLQEVPHRVLVTPRPSLPQDDMALLLVRTKVVSAQDVACWQFAAEPDSVAGARAMVAEQLGAWDLEQLTYTTELVVSELMTNAIRYAGGPVTLRLLRERVLICEVSDPSNTQPRLLRARETDEGGRGLFIVAQCTTRWGSRYGHKGKTIWTEQPLNGMAEQFATALPGTW